VVRGLAVAVVVLGIARDPGCNSVDDPSGGPNAPCTRSKDCGRELVCVEGVCRDPLAPDAGPKVEPSDGGRDE
jgi:hypothetical protein